MRSSFILAQPTPPSTDLAAAWLAKTTLVANDNHRDDFILSAQVLALLSSNDDTSAQSRLVLPVTVSSQQGAAITTG